MKRIALVLLSLGLAMSAVACGDKPQAPQASESVKPTMTLPPESPGKEIVPSFSFTDMEGKAYTPEDFKGKTVVFSFGATWCPDCQREFPVLQAVANRYKDDSEVVIVPIFLLSKNEDNTDRESAETVKANFVSKYPDLPPYLGEAGALREALEIKWIPTLYIMGPNGKALEIKKNDEGQSIYYISEDVDEATLSGYIDAAKALK